MKLQLRYKFFATEDEAREFCDRENLAHPRRKMQAHFTEWSSPNPSDPSHFIAWYQIQTGMPVYRAGTEFELREIDAWAYDDGWSYNTTYRLGTFTTCAQDKARAFRRALARLGIRFYRGKTRTEFDGDVYEIVNRKTGEPLFCAVPVGQV